MPMEVMGAYTAAERCGIGYRTFLRLVEAGRIEPLARLGKQGAILFDPDDVEKLRDELMAEAMARFEP